MATNSSKAPPIVPPLEMASLRQIDQQQHEDLYKIREADAQHFLEKSLILLLANNFKSTANGLEGEEMGERRRRASKGRASITSIQDFLLYLDEEAQQQIHSARSLISGRFSSDSPDAIGTAYLPPKSPRNGGGGHQKMGGNQWINALAAKSKLILMAYFGQSMGQGGIPIPHQSQQQIHPNQHSAYRYARRIEANNEGERGGGGGTRQHDEQWGDQWQQGPGGGRHLGQMGQQQLFSPNRPLNNSTAAVFSSSLPSDHRRQPPPNWQGAAGGQLPSSKGPMEGEGGWREAWGPPQGDGGDQPAWAKPAAAIPQQPLTMKGKGWKGEGGGDGRESAAAGGGPLPNRCPNQRRPKSPQRINRLEGTDLYCWWSSEDESGRQRRRQNRGKGGGSVEPPIQRGGGFERIAGQGNKSQPLGVVSENQLPEGATIGNENQAKGGGGKRTTAQAAAAPPAISIPFPPSAAASSIGGQLEGAVADPEVADLLLAYVQNNIQYHQNHRPKSLIAEAPFLNRSKTVPVIKFRHRAEENHFEERKEEKEESEEENGGQTLLSPVSRSQNLLQAAINSLDQNQQFEAVSATIRVGRPRNNIHSFAPEFEDFKAKTLPSPLKSAAYRNNLPAEESTTQTEELARLFQELGFDLNKSISKNLSTAFDGQNPDQLEEMSKTTSNWKNSFAATKERFGGSMDSAGEEAPTFCTKGEGWNGANEANPFLAKSQSGNAIQMDGKRRSNPENNFGGVQRAPNEQRRRPSQPQPQGGATKDIGHFWLQMLKTRAEANQSPHQKMALGLNAAERLQQLQQEAQQPEEALNRQSPASAASSSAGSSSTPEWAQQKYPYRKAVGGVESVAMRRNNFLAEVQRVESPSMMLGAGGTDSGRTTPLMKTLKSPSPSMEMERQIGGVNGPLNEGGGKPKGCGRFPTEQLEIGTDKKAPQYSTPLSGGNRSPDGSEASTMSTMSSSRPSLPQPAPKHNIRDQLINAGYRLTSRQSAPSFFGGAANNPFFGHSAHSHPQNQSTPQRHQPMPFRSNSPNFPATNTVIARVSELEKQHSTNAAGPQQPLPNGGQFPHSHPHQNQHFPTLTIRPPPNVPSTNSMMPPNAGQLSPRSTVFRTKPVIFLDDDDDDGQLGENKGMLLNEAGKRPMKNANNNYKNIGGKTQQMTGMQQQKSDSPKSSPRENAATQSQGGAVGADENRSPRWRGDAHFEAILPAKKEPQQKLQKTPEGIVERREPIPRTIKPTNQQQQKDSSNAEKISSPQPLVNGNLANRKEKEQKVVPSSSSSVSAVISTTSRKLPADEFLIKNEESKAADKIVPPPCYQQAAQKKKEKMREEDLEREYANSMKKSKIAGKLAGMPKFHFPLGKPIGKAENDKKLGKIRELFETHAAGQLPMENFDELCRRMDFAVYAKRAVYDACCRLNGLPVQPVLIGPASSPSTGPSEGPEQQQMPEIEPIDFNQFCVYWNRMISEAHDEASRFVFTLNAASSRYSPTEKAPSPTALFLLREDFLPMMMDLILTHSGLHFLKDAPQFYSKYCEVVIVRIFWNANRSWTGRLTANELRRSNFLQTLRLLEEVTDINKVTEYFSYEHFYVTYCKFWELDTDHDMVISREDMRRHCNGALPDRIIDRIFSAAVIRTPAEQRTVANPGPIRQQPIETIGFEDFVCFLLAEEDKRHPTSLEYWFRCVDLDGDGQISLYEMEHFYEGIEQKLMAKNMETLALRDVICNLLDSISPANGYSVTRNDLKRSGLAHRFFNTFVNWIKYVDQESSDGERASVKTTGDKEISDWEVFCLTEYELLMAETEQMSNEGDVEENIDVILDDDDEEAAILSDGGEHRLNGFLQHKQQQTSKAMIG